jgi:ATP-dependent Clp protease ATP-binding subunit ClpC
MVRDSTELKRVLEEADDIAKSTGAEVSTAHILLALFTVQNPAEALLKERAVDEDALLARLTTAPREPTEVVQAALARTREIARGLGSPHADTLHLLVALTRVKESLAFELLEKCGVQLAHLRNTALSYLSGRMPRRLAPAPAPRAHAIVAPAATAPAPAPAPASASVSVAETVIEPVSVTMAEPATHGRYALDPDAFPMLSSLGRNLTQLAADARLDPVVARDVEVDEVIDILGKRRTNNPCLVGEPGVGKTAVVEGVAQRLLREGRDERIIVELDMATVLAGTQLRGSFSEKLNGIKDEVRRAGGRVVVFIDEIHTIVGAGATGEGPQDAANELKAALARGEFPCIGATTHDEFRKHIAADPALERRFTAVAIREPSVQETVRILEGVCERYAEHHGVDYTPEALEAAAALSARFIRDRRLPDKAIAAIDLAGSRARRDGSRAVGREAVARAVARLAGLPEDRLLVSDADRFLRLEESLAARVVGHRAVIARVAGAVRRNYAGFSAHRPMASFLFAGPSGVGKTELARALAQVLFGSADALARLDMSEFAEAHAVSRLLGAPPGYVGYGDGGLLTEPVRRRPATVVLLDEADKAHPSALQVLTQVLDEGQLADSKGRRVDFTSTVLVLTATVATSQERPLGFGAAAAAPAHGAEPPKHILPADVWARLDERLLFGALARDEVAEVARRLLAETAERLRADRRIELSFAPDVVELLLGGWDARQGARGLRQSVQRLVEESLAGRILAGAFAPGSTVLAAVRDGALAFEAVVLQRA